MIQRHTSGRVRGAVVVAVAAMASIAVACAPPPGPIVFEGGTFDVDVEVPSQSFTYEFLICSTTASTQPIQLTGATIDVPQFEVDTQASTVSVPGVTVEIPPATPAAGSINISCLGTSLGTVDISLAIGGLVSVQTATYDVNSGVLSLDDASVLLDGVSVEIPLIGSVPLPAFEVELGSISIPL